MSDPKPTQSVYRRGARLILRSLRAHPGPHAAAMAGAFGFVLATIGFAWVLGWVTDEIILDATDGPVDRQELAIGAAAVVAISLSSGLSVVARRWFLVMATLRTQRDWRRRLLHRYVDLPLSFHRARPAGELLAHADADLETATMVLQPLAFSVSVVLMVAVALAVLLTVHPLLALIAAVLFPALAVISRVYTKRVLAPSAEVQRRVGEVSSVAHESFDGAVVVKTLGRESDEVQRLRLAAQGLRDERIRVGRMRATFEPVIDMLPTVGTIALMLVGAWLVERGSASPGDLVLSATLFSMLAMPLRIVGFFLEEMPRSVVSLERVDSVLDLPVDPPVVSGRRRLPTGPLSLRIENLTVAHGDHQVLSDVTLSVEPAETVALVGATGSGKTTLLEAVAGLIDTQGGSVHLGGVPLGEIDPAELTNTVALVFQEAFLFADTVTHNVTLREAATTLEGISRHARHTEAHTQQFVNDAAGVGPSAASEVSAEVHAALVTAAADTFVAELADGAATVVGERGVTLSGGQRQRVALARALVRSPRLLMLDDATSAVDPVVEAEILANLRRSHHATTLVVAHRLSTIELADRVAFLDSGRIAAVGTHQELLARADYRSLVTAYERDQAPGGLPQPEATS